MLDFFRPLISPELSIIEILPRADRVVLVARPTASETSCPCCGSRTSRVHSHYQRRLADLPWHGRVVEVQLQARRWRCINPECPRKIFTERLPETVLPKARRMTRLCEHHLAIGFAAGGEPGSRLSRKLGMPVSGDTLLRMVRVAACEPISAPRVVGVDDWAWRKGQRYGTIICDLERNRVLDLLPDRNADTLASWLGRYPGIEVIARDRAGVYAEGARRGAPNAIQVADRFHLLQNLGQALRLVVDRNRVAVNAAGKAIVAGTVDHDDAEKAAVSAPTGLERLRQDRRDQRRERHEEIRYLHRAGMSPRQIAPRLGISVRTVERWLAAGGEPEHRRSESQSTTTEPFRKYLEKRWQEGQRNGAQLWEEIKQMGFRGGRATVYRWTAKRKEKPTSTSTPKHVRERAPSRRECVWFLSRDAATLDERAGRFLRHLYEHAPKLETASELAGRFAALIRGDDENDDLERWIADARDSELASFAAGIERDIEAVKAAITEPWSTSPVEGQINRLKMIKRQMYGRSGYNLLKSKVLARA
ncbi:ISL3 family transposase [Sinorhizobium meliloti]|uniref:ISL3 family transposase n=3 Tax=Rhizobium meliloti TaxID=382 RepID=UPI00398C9CB2